MQPSTTRRLLNWSQISRRGFVYSLATIPCLRAQESTPSCILTSEQEEGPYYIDGATLRRDVTEAKPGVPLTLRIALSDAKRCAPLTNAAVDIWHCDAGGVYSGFAAEGPRGGRDGRMPPPFPGGRGPRTGPRTNDANRFLRGVQITNQQGMVEFATVYPGWYQGRAIHIHLKVHTGGHVSHTGQLFFPEDTNEQIARLQPYAQHLDVHRTTEQQDGVFRSQHGSSSIVRLEKTGNGSGASGFVATVSVAVDPELMPQPVDGRGRGPGGPPPPPR